MDAPGSGSGIDELVSCTAIPPVVAAATTSPLLKDVDQAKDIAMLANYK